jgi:small-conductance mechanosensitive channel/CRP-like cAMP-binding protein
VPLLADLTSQQKIALAACVGAFVGLEILLTVAIRRADRKKQAIANTWRATRNVFVPLLLAFAIARYAFGIGSGEPALQIVETMVWIAGIHVLLSLTGSTLFRPGDAVGWRGKMPKLFYDILRALILALGVAIVVSSVWNVDLSALIATLGVTSIVLGLALQETLGNLIAGIAVLFERPFQIGDWIKVGDLLGKVHEINWRSVRVRTRAHDLVVVPHSLIAKEKITNYSQPTLAHAEYPKVGFSYEDPPNKVKRVLMQVALNTRGILADPAPEVRVTSYADFSIEYTVRFMLEEYDRQPQILSEFMTQIWYAARRNGLTIPFPTQTVYETRMPLRAAPPRIADPASAIQNVPVFVPLGREELEELAREAILQDFGKGERIVHQGDPGETLYIITAGQAVVSLQDQQGVEKEVARLSRGEFFGEMALLTGEPRTANVTAVEDLTALVIHKETLSAMLARRPALAEEIAQIVEARRQGLRAIRDLKDLSLETRSQIREGAGVMLARIKRFFGI